MSGSAAKTALRASDATRIFQIGGHGAEIELSKGAHHHCPSPLGHRFSRFDPELLNAGSYRGEPHLYSESCWYSFAAAAPMVEAIELPQKLPQNVMFGEHS